MTPTATTEAREITGDATPIPAPMFWVMWVGVFFAMIWGFQVLLGSRRSVPHGMRAQLEPMEGELDDEEPAPPQ